MVTLATAPLLAEVTTISKPVRSSRHLPMTRVRVPVFQTCRPVNAADVVGSFDNLMARSTTLAATRSRSIVVLPVPGGPLTANRPEAGASSAMIASTANCWLRASGLFGAVGQRPGGTRSGATWS